MKKIFRSLVVLAFMFSVIFIVDNAIAKAEETFNLNGVTDVAVPAKSTAAISFSLAEKGALDFKTTVVDKSSVWLTLYDSNHNKIMSDTGRWTKDEINGVYNLVMANQRCIAAGDYTLEIENSAKTELNISVTTRYIPIAMISCGQPISYYANVSQKIFYLVELTEDGCLVVDGPTTDNTHSIDFRLLTLQGEELDNDDTDPDWAMDESTGISSMTWTTKNVGKGTYILEIDNGSSRIHEGQMTVKVPVQSIKVSKEKVTLKVKKSFQIKAVISPATATDKSLTYESSNKKVATVSKTGKIKAKKKGKATIYVKSSSGVIAKIKVVVK